MKAITLKTDDNSICRAIRSSASLAVTKTYVRYICYLKKPLSNLRLSCAYLTIWARSALSRPRVILIFSCIMVALG